MTSEAREGKKRKKRGWKSEKKVRHMLDSRPHNLGGEKKEKKAR